MSYCTFDEQRKICSNFNENKCNGESAAMYLLHAKHQFRHRRNYVHNIKQSQHNIS